MKMDTGGSYLRPSEAKKGAVVEFLDEGVIEISDKYTYEDGSPKKSVVFNVRYEGNEVKLRLNKASRVSMIGAFGNESKDWIGKKAKLIIVPTPNGDNKMILLEPVTEEAWDE